MVSSCTSLQRVILWHGCFHSISDLTEMARFFSTSTLPSRITITVVQSPLYIGYFNDEIEDFIRHGMRFRRDANSRLQREMNVTTDIRDLLARNTDSELSAWIVKYAPRLPASYHRWAAQGIDLHDAPFRTESRVVKYFPSMDLSHIASSHLMNFDLDQILGSWIVYEKLPNIEPPPASLVTVFCPAHEFV